MVSNGMSTNRSLHLIECHQLYNAAYDSLDLMDWSEDYDSLDDYCGELSGKRKVRKTSLLTHAASGENYDGTRTHLVVAPFPQRMNFHEKFLRYFAEVFNNHNYGKIQEAMERYFSNECVTVGRFHSENAPNIFHYNELHGHTDRLNHLQRLMRLMPDCFMQIGDVRLKQSADGRMTVAMGSFNFIGTMVIPLPASKSTIASFFDGRAPEQLSIQEVAWLLRRVKCAHANFVHEKSRRLLDAPRETVTVSRPRLREKRKKLKASSTFNSVFAGKRTEDSSSGADDTSSCAPSESSSATPSPSVATLFYRADSNVESEVEGFSTLCLPVDLRGVTVFHFLNEASLRVTHVDYHYFDPAFTSELPTSTAKAIF